MAQVWPTVLGGALLVFSRVFGISVVLPGFRSYAATLTPDAFLAGVALGAYAVTLALMQVPMGMLSDRVGRMPALWLGTLLFVGGSLWAASADSIGTLVAARLVQGTGAVSSVAMAMVGETLPPGRRTTGMAVVGIAAGGGFMLGLLVGPILGPAVGVPGLFVLVAVVGGLALLPLLAVRPGAVAEDLGHPGSAGAATVALAVCGFTANVALMAVMFHIAGAGAPIVPVLLVALAAMLMVGRAADRRGWGWPALLPGLFGLAVGGPALILLDGAWAWAGGALFFSSHASLAAILPSLVSRQAGTRGGRGHGIQSLLSHPGSFVGAVAAGTAAQFGADAAVFAGVALLATATAGVLVAVGRSGTASARGGHAPTFK